MKRLCYFLLFIITFSCCKHELESPTWETDMIVPLANLEMTITDLIQNSNNEININLSNDSLVSLIFSSEILNIDLS